MSSEEEDNGIDVDSPRPPIMLMQDAYDVTRDFFFFLKKGIKEGGHFEWYEAAAATAKELAAKTSNLKPDIANNSKPGSGVAKSSEAGEGFVAGVTQKFASCGCVVYDSACWVTHKCGQTCCAKQSVAGALNCVKSTLTRSSTGASESKSRKSDDPSGHPPSLPPGFEPSPAADKLASILTSAAKPTMSTDSQNSDSRPKREVKDFLNDLPHAKKPDYPAAFYNVGVADAAPAASTTIFLQPQKKRIQPQTDSFEDDHGSSHIPPARRFEHSVPFVQEPEHNLSAKHDFHQPSIPSFGGGFGSNVGGGGDNIQRDLSSSHAFGSRFGTNSGNDHSANVSTGRVAPQPPSAWAPSGFVGRPGAGPGMDLIDDTIAKFEAQYQKMDGQPSMGGGGGDLVVNGFGAIPPPFSQSTVDYQPSSFFGAKPFRGSGGYSPPSPQHDPARSAFTPPAGSKYSPQPQPAHHTYEESNFQERPSYESSELRKPKVRQAGRQWPPPSNATGAAYEKEDITRLKQQYQSREEEPCMLQYNPPTFDHPHYMVDEPAVEQELYQAMRPRDPSPPRPVHQSNPPSYQQYSSRARPFSPVLYSAPRPFSPTYDAPKPFGQMSRSFGAPAGGTAFDGGYSNTSRSFGQPSSINVIRVDGRSEDLDHFKIRTSGQQPKMGVLL